MQLLDVVAALVFHFSVFCLPFLSGDPASNTSSGDKGHSIQDVAQLYCWCTHSTTLWRHANLSTDNRHSPYCINGVYGAISVVCMSMQNSKMFIESNRNVQDNFPRNSMHQMAAAPVKRLKYL